MRQAAEPAPAKRVRLTDTFPIDTGEPVKPEEQQKLKALQHGLDRFELHGDVGRMVYLALENASDEREPSTPPRAQPARRRRRRTLFSRLGDILSRIAGRGADV